MAFTEITSIVEIIILPLESNVQIKRRTVVEKDGEVLSTKEQYQLYAFDNAEVVALLEDANAKGIADAAEALAAKATAESALTAAQAQVAALQAQIDAYTPPAVAEPVADPEGPSVDDLQIRLALNASGLREAVELAVLGSDQSTKDWWDRASNFKRLNPMVVALGAVLGKTDEELDGLWALAGTLG